MGVTRALADGIGRVNRAPAIVAGVVALTLATALPLGLGLGASIAGHLGASLAAAPAATGANWEWWQEYLDRAVGVGRTFQPSIIGAGAVVANLSALADAVPLEPAVVAAVAFYLLAWTFLAGGILDRFARNRPTRAHAFFAASGVFFFRFLRLGVLAGAVYYALFVWLHPLLFDGFYQWAIRDLTVERTAFGIRLALYLVFFALAAAAVLVFDYARVRAVVEDRRSMIGAVAASVRFIARHPGQVAGLYLLTGAVFVSVVVVYLLVAPGARTSGWSLVGAVVMGQVFLAARLWVKLVFSASEVALFQGELAHAGYVAAPVADWPESPAAEAIGPAEPLRPADSPGAETGARGATPAAEP